jgi:K+-sensing histidine kinase KdpD
MAGIFPFKSSSQPASISQPSLRLIAGGRGNQADAIVRAPARFTNTAVLACLTAANAGNGELLLKAHAAAREHRDRFYAAFVDSPRSRLGNAERRTLIEDAVLAGYLGAKIVWLDSSDMVGELIQVARQSGVGRIFIARARPRRFARLFRRNVYSGLLRRGAGFKIDVVGVGRDD